tara:strand:- start:3982 stop:4212 length:231 start_codon:yes stop_codon:yes gene_type:complete
LSTNLLSEINIKGKIVTQIIHFVGGIKRTYPGIISSSVKQGQFTKFECIDGSMVMVNDANVLCIEVFSELDEKDIE